MSVLQIPDALADLMAALRCLPGVGPKSAQRLAFHLLQRDRVGAGHLAQALAQALAQVGHCRQCHTFSEFELCALCADSARQQHLLCVVEMPSDVLMIEQTQCYQGLYFVLLGRLSPLDGLGPEAIALDRLLQRALNGVVQEVILATNYTVEGEATAHYLASMLKARGLSVSRIARGLPVGGELEHVDGATLTQALVERRTWS